MARATILKTNKGTKLLGTTQCSNGAYWNAEGCFKYCNSMNSDFRNEHQSNKLLSISTELGHDSVKEKDWWKNRKNFVDIEIDYNVNQEYAN